MYQYKGHEDTIVAMATAFGSAGLSVVRLSGSCALKVVDTFFQSKTQKSLKDWKTFTSRYGWIKFPGTDDILDEVLVLLMRSPKSYTTEEVVEVSCHGGPAAAQGVVELCLEAGARLAEPGEFTKRAFLNGRIDLTQAEAVLDVVTSRTQASLKAATHQLEGELSQRLHSFREGLLKIFTSIEAILNFPEEDTDQGQVEDLTQNVARVQSGLNKLLRTAHAGCVIRQGVRVVLCGRTNVGKSSLMNALLRQPRAIVTDEAGTTRDTLEEGANIAGIPVNLIDTAGFLSPRNAIEEEAVRRSRQSIDGADIIILVLDASQPLQQEDQQIIESLHFVPAIVVFNKIDLDSVLDEQVVLKELPGQKMVHVSAVTKKGLDDLEALIVEQALGNTQVSTDSLMLSNIRQVATLKRAEECLQKALVSLKENAPLEIVSSDIKSAVTELDAVTGREIDEDLLDSIFSQFCIGK